MECGIGMDNSEARRRADPWVALHMAALHTGQVCRGRL